MTSDLALLVDGVDFGEGPRWHDGRLWYSDFHQRAVYTVTGDGTREAVHADLDDQPSGLGWLPDGTLLVVSMLQRQVLREQDGVLVLHADLSDIATGNCNDMVVSAEGNAYVGNFGFDFDHGGAYQPADLALVRPDGSTEVVAPAMGFPNGSVITPDGSTLIVGESFGGDYVAFTIADDGTLADRRVWAETPGMAPDGCTLDADGAIWFADALGARLVRVREGGEITHEIATPMGVFACALGGDDGRTLHALCAPGAGHDECAGKAAGAVYTTRVDVPHAGLP